MRNILRWTTLLVLALAAAGAHAQSCTPVSGSASVIVTDIFGGSVDVQGSVDFDCTRPAGNPRFPTSFWVGVSGANGSRTLSNGGNSLAYGLYTDYATCGSAWEGANGVLIANALTANTDRTLNNVTGQFCLRIPTGQITARPLTYLGSATITVRSLTSTGTLWGTGVLSLTATVNPICKFSTSPGTLVLAYTSFQTGNTDNATSFDMQCTNGTSFGLSLDAVTGTALGITYSIGLGTLGTLSLPSQVGAGAPINYSVPGRVAPNQVGTCATGSTCIGNDSRTVTVTY